MLEKLYFMVRVALCSGVRVAFYFGDLTLMFLFPRYSR